MTNDRSRIGFGHFCNIFYDLGLDIDRNTIADFMIMFRITRCTTFGFILNSVFKKVAALSHLVLFAFKKIPIVVVFIL
jgi:hypothetical protein